MFVKNVFGLAMDFCFADKTRLLVRLHELAPEHPLAQCLPFLVELHGPVVDITLPHGFSNLQISEERAVA